MNITEKDIPYDAQVYYELNVPRWLLRLLLRMGIVRKYAVWTR